MIFLFLSEAVKIHQFTYLIYWSNLIKMTSFLNKSKLLQSLAVSPEVRKYLVTSIIFVTSRHKVFV